MGCRCFVDVVCLDFLLFFPKPMDGECQGVKFDFEWWDISDIKCLLDLLDGEVSEFGST